MISQLSRWLAALLVIVVAESNPLPAQSRDAVSDLSEARRVFVPLEDLDVIIERDKQGVILPRAKFDVMLTQARANAEKNAVPKGVPVVVTNADYTARVVKDQLLISVVAELTQFEENWFESRFALQRLSIEQALVDDVPALLGRHADGSVSLFTEARGKHVLKLQLSAELTALGSDQVAAFALLRAPSGTFSISLPAGKRLLVGNLQLERPAPLDQVADYSIAVGGTPGIQLRITDRAAENSADALTFASTGYGLNVAPGEVSWHALTTLQVFGKPVDRLTFSVPRTLEIAEIEATGLERWELSDDPDDNRRTNISLTFGQAFEGARKISLKGVMAVEIGEAWAVPALQIQNVTSHIGQVIIHYPAGVRLRVEAAAGVRRATQEQKPAADMPDEMSNLTATEILRFDIWQSNFLLQLTTQPKEREVHMAVAAVLDVNATGLDLEAALTVETRFAPLFEVDIRLPAEWQIVSAQRDNQPLKWQVIGLDEAGVNQLRILLEPPVAVGANSLIRLALRRDVEGWPVEAQPVTVNLPELFLPQSSLTEGAFVIRGDQDLDIQALDLAGLDSQPLKAPFERLRFQSQDSRYSGKLRVTRKPSRIAVQTVTFGRIDPQVFHTFIQSTVDVQGGGVRSVSIALPESAGTSIRFECPNPRIVEQKSTAGPDGERIWTLQFDQRLRGQALIACDIESPRPEGQEFVVPQCRFLEAERQNGYFAVEAGGEQRLTIVANDAGGTPLPEVDPLELPNVYYVPQERIVAVYRAPAAGAVFTLNEEKFARLPVPTAVCPLLQISTILGGTGELQHRATFDLHVVGVQGLHVTLPAGSTLWATLVNGRPVEVRRNGDVYLVPLVAMTGASSASQVALDCGPAGTMNSRTLQLFYRSEVNAISQFGTLNQSPPTLTVESGQRTALPVEILQQKWDLHYPQETRLIDSHSPLEPQQPLDRTSLLEDWKAGLRVPVLNDLGWKAMAVAVSTVIILLLRIGFLRRRVLLTQVIVALVLLTGGIALLLPTVQRSKGVPVSAPAPYSADQEGLERSVARKQLSARNRFRYAAEEAAGAAKGPAPGMSLPQVQLNDETVDAFNAKQESGKPQANEAEFAQREKMDGQPAEPADRPDLAIRQNQAVESDSGDGKLALLSLAIDFLPPAGSREKTFQYVGADNAVTGVPLEVDYVDRHSGNTLRLFIVVLVAMIGWILRRVSTAMKLGLLILGLVVPLALLPVAPANWLGIMDGLCLGSLIVLALWLIRACIQCCCRCAAWCFPNRPNVASAVVALVLVASSATVARADEAAPNSSAPPVPSSTTLIVPFDAGTEPLASERVFLSHEQFLQLYRLAYPDQVSKNPAPQAGGIFEAIYAAKIVANPTQPDDSVIEVTARYAVKSFVDGQLIVDLPVGQVAAREAKLDGQTAALIAGAGTFKVAVPKPGLHVIDFIFTVPARLSGTTGSFSIPLLPVPAGKLSFELPGKDLATRVNGSSTVFRLVAQDELKVIELPIDKGGDIAVSWQPEQAQGAAAAVIHVDSVEAVTLTDAGINVSHGFSYRIRQGSVADTSFTMPDTLRLQSISGPDMGGWELQGEGASRKLRVIFRRNVSDQTRLTIEAFLDIKIDTDSQAIAVPQVAPLEVTNEIGQVAVFAGNQFSVRAEQRESLTQIDSDKFTTQIPLSRPNVVPQLAYRFSARPFALTLRATRQESQAHVTSQQAAFIALRKQHVTSRFRYNLTGAPRSSLSFTLPPAFVLLDVQATGLRDYYLTKQEEGDTLTIELNAPRLGLTEVVIGGFVPRDAANNTVVFPLPLDVTRIDTTAAVWLDEGLIGTLEEFEGWRSVDVSAANTAELSAVRPNQPIQFAFLSSNLSPSPMTFKLKQANAKLSANGLSMVTVTDIAVIYMLALQWQVDIAKTDTLTLTTPSWLAGKLDFQGQGIRETTHADAGNDRTRWTIHLRAPVSGKYFATATATLPPANDEVLAPSLVFESEQNALDSQRQYVLLINSSLSQLSNVDPSLVESVQREDVPVVVEKEFVDQATELVRVKKLLTAPRWSLHKFIQQSTAPASVNAADLTTVLSRDGTYRGQAIYTIKNRSRQFLALKMPENSELLSVFVSGQPSRAVLAALPSLKGESAQMIALPKTSAAGLSFPVKIVWRGRLPGPLPKSAKLTSDEFSVPAPQILSQQEDPEYGIPVARTRWSVYLPDDLDVEASRSTSRHNLSLSNDGDNIYGNAILQEAGDLLGYFEQLRESNRRVQTRNNLKQIDVTSGNLQQIEAALGRYNDSSSSDFARNKADIMKRLSEVKALAAQENQKSAEYFTKLKNPAQQQNAEAFLQQLSEGELIANDQQQRIEILNNPSAEAKVTETDGNFNFGLAAKDADMAPGKTEAKPSDAKASGKAGSGDSNASRAMLQNYNGINLDALNDAVTTNNTIRLSRTQANRAPVQSANPSENRLNSPSAVFSNGGVAIDNNAGGSIWNPQNAGGIPFGQVDVQGPGGQPAFPGGMGFGGFGVANGAEPADGMMGGMGGGMGGGFGGPGGPVKENLAQQQAMPQVQVQGAVPNASAGKQTAGLSLSIDLPTSGRKLVFSKVGGDPKLALTVRSKESIRWGISLVWSALWLLMAASILFTLRKASGLTQLWRQVPWFAVIIGVLGFCVLPGPLAAASFAVFLCGMILVAFQRRVIAS